MPLHWAHRDVAATDRPGEYAFLLLTGRFACGAVAVELLTGVRLAEGSLQRCGVELRVVDNQPAMTESAACL
ncbi:MAG: hypothetical protein GY903_17305 [Fuerstiella sp.]|nr:hypothetical protein [Fuerstiella sp.]MCP4782248.1 hypothetical protein [Fuerstiella sp.]MCP4856241.1 hypothetical protein [Fuerstiella sp.]